MFFFIKMQYSSVLLIIYLTHYDNLHVSLYLLDTTVSYNYFFRFSFISNYLISIVTRYFVFHMFLCNRQQLIL